MNKDLEMIVEVGNEYAYCRTQALRVRNRPFTNMHNNWFWANQQHITFDIGEMLATAYSANHTTWIQFIDFVV